MESQQPTEPTSSTAPTLPVRPFAVWLAEGVVFTIAFSVVLVIFVRIQRDAKAFFSEPRPFFFAALFTSILAATIYAIRKRRPRGRWLALASCFIFAGVNGFNGHMAFLLGTFFAGPSGFAPYEASQYGYSSISQVQHWAIVMLALMIAIVVASIQLLLSPRVKAFFDQYPSPPVDRSADTHGEAP